MSLSKLSKVAKIALCVFAVASTTATIVACSQIADNTPKQTDKGVKTLLEDYATYEKKVRQCQRMGASYSVSYDACVNP